MRYFLLAIICLLSSKNLYPQAGYGYIDAPSGLNVRSGPGVDHDIVEKLAYGRWVRILDTTDIQLTIRDEGRLVTGNWMQIRFEPYPGANSHEEIEGYAFGPFLTKAIQRIPPHSLLYAWEISSFTSPQEYVADYSYRIEISEAMSDERRQYPYDFPGFFEEVPGPAVLTVSPYVLSERKEITIQAVRDSLDAHLELELISEQKAQALRRRAIRNPYAIDPTPVYLDLAPNTWQNDFLLPINGGSDSLRITDYDGEGYISKRFVGTLPKLNLYVVNEEYEEPNHMVIDRTTGERRHFTMGYPMISPDGEKVLELYEVYFEEGSRLSLSTIGEGFRKTETFSVHFKTWFPRFQGGDHFWISDREICLQVAPVSQTSAARSTRMVNEPLPADGYQWLYLRIVE